ncbi:uncharacterized protein LOC109845185 isoform X1 [Asparagus officinalis]|uniref:uncharacterized protein LOC109845185 isoform X1 n=1 Tax=Asparagus officinalis TaxID=4686 RepID=UPI00098E717E|nr:uncharacterized protein LOC109845185 isoform X1 [Asparagus officinalis]
MSEPVKDCNGASVAIISEVEPKQAIEQLLMQETFSRDEGEELIKLVESRVVEVVKDEMHKEPDRTTDNVVASLRTWKYLNLSRKLPEAVSNPSGNLNANSPGYPAFQVPETELHNSAVIKAKKWLEDKKVASSSRVDFDCRACTFDTNMLQKDFGGEEGSPVDLAKSYMQSVSPWRSSLRSIRFEKTPCTGMHLYNDEAPSTTPNYSMSSSKGLKRDHPSCGLHDLVDESRRVRLKSTDGASDNSSFKLINSSERNSKDEACITSYAAEKHIHHNSNNEGPVDEVQLMRETPLSGTSPSVVIAEQATIGNASLASLLSRGRSSVGIGPAFPHSEEKQDVEEHCQVKVQLDSLSGPCTTPTLAPTTKEHAGLMEQDRIDTIQDGAVQKQEKKDQIQDESNRLRISADGPSAGLSTGINVALEEDRSAANFSNEEGTFELPSTYNTKVPAAKTTKSKTRASSGSRGRAKMKSVKDPLWKPEPSVSRGRGRKSVPGARRGRGV